jgi:hypothetical protein
VRGQPLRMTGGHHEPSRTEGGVSFGQ